MQRLNFTILRWIFDNLIALIFIGNKVDLDLGLPLEIKQIDFEKYPEVRGRVIAFNMAVRFDRSVELVLSAEDINILHAEVYGEYSRRPVKDKILARLEYFEIHNNEIIISEISPFLYFTSNNPLLSKRAVKFYIENGKLVEYCRFISTFNQTIDNSEYQLVNEKLSSGIIHFMLASKTPDCRNLKSLNQITKEASPIIKKLKSIRVRDSQFILES
ncbi:MAG: hypothetical protein KI793_25690 [Rivularia sp. (in: Bacteria)]|nr:hypothetical protein [Rivularia sp. MS3]